MPRGQLIAEPTQQDFGIMAHADPDGNMMALWEARAIAVIGEVGLSGG
jgi:hypothetical protein